MKPNFLFLYFYVTTDIHRINLLFEKTILALLLVFTSATSFALPSYRVVVIPTPTDLANFGEPVRDFRPIVINDDRHVAGTFGDAYQCGHATICMFGRAFRYHSLDGLHYLGTLGGKSSSAQDINESSQIVGSSKGGDGVTHAFLWDTESGMNDITPSFNSFASAKKISNTGIVIGSSFPYQFEWRKDSELQLTLIEQGENNITFLEVADNGTKLKKVINNERAKIESFFLSVSGQNDFFLGKDDRNTNDPRVTVFEMNRNGVAAAFKEQNNRTLSTFVADASTRQIITVLGSGSTSALAPIDINENLWMLGYNGRSLFIPGHEESLRLSSLIFDSNSVTNLTPKNMNNHGDLVGYGDYNGKKVVVILINENPETQVFQRIAQYRTDFSSSPVMNWLYQWNSGVPIGQSEGYVDMQWDRWKYDSDGMPGLPDPSGLAYGHFSANGGHPGRGSSKDEIYDRYVITGIEVDEAGEYWVNDSHIVHTGCSNSNGGVVEIYVNDNLVNSFSFDTEGETTFDGRIGLVNAGSFIYIAVGPNGSDACDRFDWDFAIDAIILVPKGNLINQPPVLDELGKQINRIGDDIQLILNASDPEEDILSFEATGLPDGLTIDSESGIISGNISPISSSIKTHDVSVVVSDDQGETNTVNFNWVIYGENLVARYSIDFAENHPIGWSYQWNSRGPIGQSSNYKDLLWTGFKYDIDGVSGFTNDNGLRYYDNLNPQGGHPGRGTLQGEKYDLYVIAGFTVDTTDEYQIKDSLVKNNSCRYGNGGVVQVYVGDKLIDSTIFKAGVEVLFDTTLGIVEAGETIYIALGPNGKDSCDGFEWDFAIELL